MWFHSLFDSALFSFLSPRFPYDDDECDLCVCVCVFVWRLSASFFSMITAIMSVDLSSTCLFTFSANTRHSHVNCIFLFRHTDTEIKFPFASFHFISLVHIVSVFFAPPTFLCSHILNAWNSILYYVSHCWSRCDFKLYLWRRILLSLRSLLGASSLCFAALLIGFQDHLNSKGHIKSIFFHSKKMAFELVETHHLNTDRAAHATKTTATKMKEFNSKEREKKTRAGSRKMRS